MFNDPVQASVSGFHALRTELPVVKGVRSKCTACLPKIRSENCIWLSFSLCFCFFLPVSMSLLEWSIWWLSTVRWSRVTTPPSLSSEQPWYDSLSLSVSPVLAVLIVLRAGEHSSVTWGLYTRICGSQAPAKTEGECDSLCVYLCVWVHVSVFFLMNFRRDGGG